MNNRLNLYGMQSMSRRAAARLLLAVAASPLAITVRAAAQAPLLAIKGYDPVAYFTDGKPTPGLPSIEHEWDGHIYRFASAEHRDRFKVDPVRYAPQFGNFCAMALSKSEIVVADPENWLVTDGKLYIFGKPAPAGPALFQKDLAANIARANQSRPILPRN
jgi:hypothetical protein